jgi:hypothetical protein
MITPPFGVNLFAACTVAKISLDQIVRHLLPFVLVILGLLVGGVLAGQSLIRAAELRSISTDIGKYEGAMYAFRDKYLALPGDMTNASAFWGLAADCTYGAVKSTGTCNGNGNGQWIEAEELGTVWQHLNKAGILEGSYNGSYTSPLLPGTNVPRGKIANTGFVGATNGGTYYGVPGSTRRTLMFYIADASASGPLSAEETWNIDTKMDDGRASTGRFTA